MNTTPFGVKISRIMREIHAATKHHNADSLAKSIGIAGARGNSMKKILLDIMVAMLFVAASVQSRAQGFVYDQQSTVQPSIIGDYLNIQEDSPITQSFVPELSAINFVQLEFWDIPNNGDNGATVYVNLWTGSPNPGSATLLGSTTPVYMPNGFGSDVAGVTNFYFASSITITPGETYYLQPVVLSGDNPWDIYAPGETYPNGELYEDGNGFGEDDLWFREGIEAVPEPSSLVLIGFGGLLIYVFKRRSKLPILFIVGSIFAIQALSVNAASDSVVQATADAAGLTPVSAVSTPLVGTFWVTTVNPNGGLTTLPYPILPTNMTELPIYSITNDIFLVDDTGGQITSQSDEHMTSSEASAVVQAESQTIEHLIEMEDEPPVPTTNGIPEGTNFPPFTLNALPPIADTTNIWLEATVESTNIELVLHNTDQYTIYQMLSTTNLLNTNWDLGQIYVEPYGGYANFNPIPYNTNAMMFFRAHQSNLRMAITVGQNAVEPTNSTSGQTGVFYIANNGFIQPTNDITVCYTIGGTAQNGVDYSNITGVATIPANEYRTQVNIYPIAEGFKPNQTIILTLTQNTNFLIDPVYALATNVITANPQVYPIAIGDNERVCPKSTNFIYLQASDPRNLTLHYNILSWPTHGILNTNGIPNCTYASTNCYEGQDSFIFEASDGQFTSGPAVVNLTISNSVIAYPYSAQTCRGGTVNVQLYGGDNCNEATNIALLSSPEHGTLSGTGGYLTYTPSDTNFTGTDSFNFAIYDNCGDAATNTVTITIGDTQLSTLDQNLMTGTNPPITFTPQLFSEGNCDADANYFVYTTTNGPTNGILSESGTNITYTPNSGFEGIDSFQFFVSDGVWSSDISTIKIYVVAAPTLSTECDPFGTAVQLTWGLDTNVVAMEQEGLRLQDYIIYRSTNYDGPYASIFTNTDTSQMVYWDSSITNIGQIYYYAVSFEATVSSPTYQSPLSNKVAGSFQNPDDLIQANAYWNVETNMSFPANVVVLQTPFSDLYTNQYYSLYPLPNSTWTSGTTWSNYTTMVIPTNIDLSDVQYSIAIDNEFWLTVNGTYITNGIDNGVAIWSSFRQFPANVLHYGTNNVGVLIDDFNAPNYFSMVVTTNTCGW